MSAAECIEALERAREALDQQYRASDTAFRGKFNDLGCEARRRVNQMVWLLSEISRYLSIADEAQLLPREVGSLLTAGEITPDERHQRMQQREIREAIQRSARVNEPLETLCEAFYWIAARAREVIRLLPEMNGFEATGVRNNRNKLIEHPEKGDSGIVISSFGWGGPQGPVLKALRYSDQADKWRDNGLFNNAIEFAAALQKTAEHAVEKIHAKSASGG